MKNELLKYSKKKADLIGNHLDLDKKIIILSYELGYEHMAMILLSKLSGIEYDKIEKPNKLSDEQGRSLTKAFGELHAADIYIYAEKTTCLNEVKTKIDSICNTDPIDLIILDGGDFFDIKKKDEFAIELEYAYATEVLEI